MYYKVLLTPDKHSKAHTIYVGLAQIVSSFIPGFSHTNDQLLGGFRFLDNE